MMKKLRYLTVWLLTLLLFSCVPELGPQVLPREEKEEADSEKRVTVRFTVPGYEPQTKALGEGGSLNKLYLAVFGSSFYLKEYVEATPTRRRDEQGQPKDTTYITYDDKGNAFSHTVPCYEFEASLAMSIDDSPRYVHFLGNGPATLDFGYATSVLPAQLSANGEMAYWQMITLPHGIHARKETVTITINDVPTEVEAFTDENHDPIPDGATTGYVADEETANAFKQVYQDDEASEPREHGIALIRNWAKIVLRAEDDSHFTPISFAVVNVPTRGAMAPYSDALKDTESKGFIADYQNCSFTYLENTLKYPGTLPAGTTFDDAIPDISDFEYFEDHATETALHGVVANGKPRDVETGLKYSRGAVYLYERPAPSNRIPPSYVIIYGYYDGAGNEGDTPGNYYYKVDLMETTVVEPEEGSGQELPEYVSRYYPIYRNFMYQIVVRRILSEGSATPQEAARSAGSADVSADVNTGQLADISDGIGRLHVTPWMARTITNDYYDTQLCNELSVFFSDMTGEPYMNPDHVTVELLDPIDGGSDIITNLNISRPSQGPPPDNLTEEQQASWFDNGDARGWRRITFNTVAQENRTLRRQSIRITGYYFNDSEHGGNGRLYRDVEIALLPIQKMEVSCLERIFSDRGTEQVVTVRIPEGLLQSMFPLDFIIEAEDMTLTPNNEKSNNNLPVQSGVSLSEKEGYAGRKTIQYIKTLTWDDYLSLQRVEDEEEMLWREFDCYFLTNKDVSATTIWVANDEYFDRASTSFTNFNRKYFKNLRFDGPIPKMSNASIPVSFEMVQDDDGSYPRDYPDILVSVTGLQLDQQSGISGGAYTSFEPGPGAGNSYILHRAASGSGSEKNVTIYFKTTTPDGDISVNLQAMDYSSGDLVPFHFNQYIMESADSYELMTDSFRRNTSGMLNAQNSSAGVSNQFGSNSVFGLVNSGYRRSNPNNPEANKNIYFGYYDDPNSLNATVTLFADPFKTDGSPRVTLNTLDNNSRLYVTTGSGTWDRNFPWTPTGPQNSAGAKNYHEILIKTRKAGDAAPVSFYLSAPGYVEEYFYAERFFGRIHSIIALNNNFLTKTSNFTVDESDRSVTFSYYDSGDFGFCRFIITPQDGAPAVIISNSNPTKGIVLGKAEDGTVSGGRYQIMIETGDVPGNNGTYKQQTLLYTAFTMAPAYKPDMTQSAPAPGQGAFYLYPGSNNQYVWMMPQTLDNGDPVPVADRLRTATLDLVVPAGGNPACISSIVFRSFSDTPK